MAAVLGVATVVAGSGCSIDDGRGTSIIAISDSSEEDDNLSTTDRSSPTTISSRASTNEEDGDLSTVDRRVGEWTYRINVDPLTDNAVENLSVVAHDYESQTRSVLDVLPQLSLACDWEGRLWTFVWFNDHIAPRIALNGSRLRTDVAYRVDRGDVIRTLAAVGDDSQSVVMTDYKTLQLIERLLDKEELTFVVWDGDGTNRRVAYFPVAGLRDNQHHLSKCIDS